jgi:phosphate starvation-inducible protein PhoH and related proteins
MMAKPADRQEQGGLNKPEAVSTKERQPSRTDANHFVLTFENNRLASELFGQFDQNLKLIEDRLSVEARARGNTVAISGELNATNIARRTLDYLYDRLQKGSPIEASDVEGAIRMAQAADDQLVFPALEKKAKLTMGQISTRI